MSSFGALKIHFNLHKFSIGFQIIYFLICWFSISKHGCKIFYPTCECNQYKLKRNSILFFVSLAYFLYHFLYHSLQNEPLCEGCHDCIFCYNFMLYMLGQIEADQMYSKVGGP